MFILEVQNLILNGGIILEIKEIEYYTKDILPKIRQNLLKENDDDKLVELYELYEQILCLIAPYDFDCFNEYIEFDEVKNSETKSFHHHRKKHLAELVTALNDIEVYDKYDLLLISMPPRVGKSTYNIRFVAWVIGRHPENTQLVTSYSESIVASFYSGVLEILQNDRYKKAFPESQLVNQNAKRLELWLQVMKRYPTVSFIPIEGSMTGRAESGNYLFVDDLVSGIEQAMSPTRLEKLWTTYSVNARQRKKQGCKEIHIATRWSVNDPMSILERQNEENPRFKSIKLPCFNEDLESNFDFFGGFNTQYYLDQQNSMDEISFNALYMQEPIEREGLLYHKDDLKYYFELPDTQPDSIISICDSKNMGKDYVCSIVGYVYGDQVYLDAVVYNSGLPEVTRPKVANLWTEHKVVRGDVEMNNGGNYYAEDLQELLKQNGARTSVRTFFSSNNKLVKIITYSDYVKTNFVFRHPSTYAHRSEYAYFMKDVLSFTQTGKNKHDDSVDGLAMLAQLHQDLTGNSVKILDRKRLGL